MATNGVYTLKEVPYGVGADSLGQYAQGAAEQPDKASAPNTKTISEKRTSLIASVNATTGAIASYVYGNDDTKYINVDLKGVRVDDTYDHVDGDGINGEMRQIIDDVNTVVTGIKDVDIEVNSLPAAKQNSNAGSYYYCPDKEIFTLYKDGIVLGAVTIGDDNGSAATWAYIVSDKPRQEDYEHATGNATKAKPGEWTWYREAIVNGKITDLVEVGDNLQWIGNEDDEGKMLEGEWYEVKLNADGHVRKAQRLEYALNPDFDEDGNRIEKRYLTASKNVETQINTENGDVALHMEFTKDEYVANYRADRDTLTFKNGNLYTNSDLTKGFSVSKNVLVVLAQAELKSGKATGSGLTDQWGDHGVEACVDQFKVVTDTYETYDGLKAALDRMKSSSANFVGDLNVIFHNGAASVIIINDIWGDYINEGNDVVHGTGNGKLTITNPDKVAVICTDKDGNTLKTGDSVAVGDIIYVELNSGYKATAVTGADAPIVSGTTYKFVANSSTVEIKIESTTPSVSDPQTLTLTGTGLSVKANIDVYNKTTGKIVTPVETTDFETGATTLTYTVAKNDVLQVKDKTSPTEILTAGKSFYVDGELLSVSANKVLEIKMDKNKALKDADFAAGKQVIAVYYDPTKLTVVGKDATETAKISKNEGGVLLASSGVDLKVTVKDGGKYGIFTSDTAVQVAAANVKANEAETGAVSGTTYLKPVVVVAGARTDVKVTLTDTAETAVAPDAGVIPGTPLKVSVVAGKGTGVIEDAAKPGADVTSNSYAAKEVTLAAAVKVNLNDGITATVGGEALTAAKSYVKASESGSTLVTCTANTEKGTTVLALAGSAKHAAAAYDGKTGTSDIDLYMGVKVTFTTTGVTTGAVYYQTTIGSVGNNQQVVASSADGSAEGFIKSGTTLYIYGVPAKTAAITAGSNQVADLTDTGMTSNNQVIWTCTAGIKDIAFAQDQT